MVINLYMTSYFFLSVVDIGADTIKLIMQMINSDLLAMQMRMISYANATKKCLQCIINTHDQLRLVCNAKSSKVPLFRTKCRNDLQLAPRAGAYLQLLHECFQCPQLSQSSRSAGISGIRKTGIRKTVNQF